MYVNETTTPSGIEVRFEAPDKEEPRAKRRYLLAPPEGHELYGDPTTTDEWEEIESKSWLNVAGVTDVLDILDKPALPWWGQTTGVTGMLQLFNTGAIWHAEIPGRDRPVIVCPAPPEHPEHPSWGSNQTIIAGPDEITYWLTAFKLTTNHQRDKGADKGQVAHDAFELWCREGIVPDLSIYPDETRGYIKGLLGFIETVPFEATANEVVVASLDHRYAGRYDARGHITEPVKVCHHIVPDSRNCYWSMMDPCEAMLDLKTSKGVYNSASRQLEAYELASIESGYDPTDVRAILHVTADGLWEIRRSFARAESFLATLADWREEQFIESERKKYGGARHK